MPPAARILAQGADLPSAEDLGREAETAARGADRAEPGAGSKDGKTSSGESKVRASSARRAFGVGAPEDDDDFDRSNDLRLVADFPLEDEAEEEGGGPGWTPDASGKSISD